MLSFDQPLQIISAQVSPGSQLRSQPHSGDRNAPPPPKRTTSAGGTQVLQQSTESLGGSNALAMALGDAGDNAQIGMRPRTASESQHRSSAMISIAAGSTCTPSAPSALGGVFSPVHATNAPGFHSAQSLLSFPSASPAVAHQSSSSSQRSSATNSTLVEQTSPSAITEQQRTPSPNPAAPRLSTIDPFTAQQFASGPSAVPSLTATVSEGPVVTPPASHSNAAPTFTRGSRQTPQQLPEQSTSSNPPAYITPPPMKTSASSGIPNVMFMSTIGPLPFAGNENNSGRPLSSNRHSLVSFGPPITEPENRAQAFTTNNSSNKNQNGLRGADSDPLARTAPATLDAAASADRQPESGYEGDGSASSQSDLDRNGGHKKSTALSSQALSASRPTATAVSTAATGNPAATPSHTITAPQRRPDIIKPKPTGLLLKIGAQQSAAISPLQQQMRATAANTANSAVNEQSATATTPPSVPIVTSNSINNQPVSSVMEEFVRRGQQQLEAVQSQTESRLMRPSDFLQRQAANKPQQYRSFLAEQQQQQSGPPHRVIAPRSNSPTSPVRHYALSAPCPKPVASASDEPKAPQPLSSASLQVAADTPVGSSSSTQENGLSNSSGVSAQLPPTTSTISTLHPLRPGIATGIVVRDSPKPMARVNPTPSAVRPFRAVNQQQSTNFNESARRISWTQNPLAQLSESHEPGVSNGGGNSGQSTAGDSSVGSSSRETVLTEIGQTSRQIEQMNRTAARTSSDYLQLQERIERLCDLCSQLCESSPAAQNVVPGAPLNMRMRFQLRDNCNRLKTCAERLKGAIVVGGNDTLDEITHILQTVENVINR